jgi:hypothetical protein
MTPALGELHIDPVEKELPDYGKIDHDYIMSER